MLRSRNFLLVLLFQFQTAAAVASVWKPTSVCESAKKSFESRFKNLEKEYSEISSENVLPENRPTWAWGTKKEAVYLSHGFIGTPEEMSEVGTELQKLGFTVVNDILPGHGSDGYVANKYSEEKWRQHVSANLKALNTCFTKIHLIGFSTGGLLIHDFLIKNPKFKGAASLTLYSPFYQSRNQYSSFLRTAARLLTSVVSTNYLYFLTRFPDIKVASIKPNNYLQLLPLDAAGFVVKLGQQVFDYPETDFQFPTLLFVSDTDMINKTEATINKVSGDFKNLRLVHFQKDYVPHHLMVPAVSSKAKEVISQTVQFIVQ